MPNGQVEHWHLVDSVDLTAPNPKRRRILGCSNPNVLVIHMPTWRQFSSFPGYKLPSCQDFCHLNILREPSKLPSFFRVWLGTHQDVFFPRAALPLELQAWLGWSRNPDTERGCEFWCKTVEVDLHYFSMLLNMVLRCAKSFTPQHSKLVYLGVTFVRPQESFVI